MGALNSLPSSNATPVNPAVLGQDFLNACALVDCPALIFERRSHCVGNCAHAATGKASRANAAVDVAHVVMQRHIGRAGRINAKPGADNARTGKMCLDEIVLEVLVKQIAN